MASSTYSVLLGVDTTPKIQSTSKINKDFAKHNIPLEQAYVLHLSSWSDTIKGRVYQEVNTLTADRDTSDQDRALMASLKNNAKDDLQPAQLRYFTRTGEPIYRMVNCYIERPLKSDWNAENCFSSFPPKPISRLDNDRTDQLQFLLPHIHRLDSSSVSMNDLPQADYYAVVFWNSFMKRPSKNLIRTVREYHTTKTKRSVYTLFVNNHNASFWHALSEKDKARSIELINR